MQLNVVYPEAYIKVRSRGQATCSSAARVARVSGRGGIPRGRGLAHLPDLRAGLDAQPPAVHLLVPQRQDGQLPRGEGGQGDHLLHHRPGHREQAHLQQRQQEGRGQLHLQPQQQRARHGPAIRHQEE